MTQRVKNEHVIQDVEILRVQAHSVSASGNPSYQLDTNKGSFLTAPDASAGYDAMNYAPGWGINPVVNLTLNSFGSIIGFTGKTTLDLRIIRFTGETTLDPRMEEDNAENTTI